MGSEIILLFTSSGSVREADAWLERVREASLDEGEVNRPRYWVDWPNKRRLELGFNFGMRSFDAMVIAREICKRWNIRKIGRNGEYYEDDAWESSGSMSSTAWYGPHLSWVEWAKVWKPEWDSDYKMTYAYLNRLKTRDTDAMVYANEGEALEEVVERVSKEQEQHLQMLREREAKLMGWVRVADLG
jgi:hypothetical protein